MGSQRVGQLDFEQLSTREHDTPYELKQSTEGTWGLLERNGSILSHKWLSGKEFTKETWV